MPKSRLTLQRLTQATILSYFMVSTALGQAPVTEGLRLGYGEAEAAANLPGYEGIENGAPINFVVDAAGELSDTKSVEDISPLIDWYQNRGLTYIAYDAENAGLDFVPTSATGFGVVGVEGTLLEERTTEGTPILTLPDMSKPTYVTALIDAAKEYIDAGVDGFQYDVGGSYHAGGSFDDTTVAGFYSWLTGTLGYTDEELSAVFGTSVSSSFNYRIFLVDEGVTETEDGYYSTGLLDDSAVRHTAHYRLWRGYQGVLEKEWTQILIDEVTAYAMASSDPRDIEFQFNRYGFMDTPARQLHSVDYVSSVMGETYLGRAYYPYVEGFTMEPIFRLYQNTFGQRFESWNEPVEAEENGAFEFVGVDKAVRAEKIAANSSDIAPDDGLLAWRYQDYIDLPTASDVAVFYPLANVQHNVTLQNGQEPPIFGSHIWYIGTGYLLNELNVDYDVVIGGDDLVLKDTITAADFSDYSAVVVPEIAQLTDDQYKALFDYANAGGHLLFIGSDLLKYDVLGNDVSGSSTVERRTTNQSYTYEDIFWSGIASAGQQTYGAGTYWVITSEVAGTNSFSLRYNADIADEAAIDGYRSTLSSALAAAGVAGKTHDGGAAIRVNSYVTSDGSDVYWLGNKNFASFGRMLNEQTNVTFSLPDPGYSGTYTVSYADDANPEIQVLTSVADSDSSDGRIEVTIPTIASLGFLKIGSEVVTTEVPDLVPAAEFVELFSYEVFADKLITSRDLAVKAGDDNKLARLEIHAQSYDSSLDTWSDWYDADQDYAPATATNRLGDLNYETRKAELSTIAVDLPALGEGRHRLRLIAVDDAGQYSQDPASIAYADTEVGYDTSPPDMSGLVITVSSGPNSGSVVNTFPSIATLSFTGVTDAQSGVDSINAASFVDGNTVDGERASDYVDGVSQSYFESVSDPAYGTYSVLARTSNLAGEYGDFESVYSFIYTLPPTFEGMSYNTVVADGTNTDGSLTESDNGVTVEAGTYVTLNADFVSVYGQGEGLVTVQWYRNGEAVEGATETSINLGAVTQDAEGEYTVVFTDPGGEVTSFSVSVDVTQGLEITSQPSGYQNDNAIAAGDSFTLSVGAVGEGTLTYQWYFKLEPGDDVYELLEGAAADSYTVESALRSEHQGRYYVVVGDDTGSTVTSNTARVEVQGSDGGGGGTASLNITQQPVGYEGANALSPGDSFTLTVGATGEPPLSYQWSFALQPGTDVFVDIDGATEASYSVASVTIADHNGRYRVTIRDGIGNTAMSVAVQVIILEPSDTDGDGVPNAGDNCPAISNPDQLDFDNDGLGDACDGDADADGVMDIGDSCPYTPIAEAVNASGCSLAQLSELDSDEDGLDDATEAELGTDPDNADTDGDGISDGDEVSAGTSPTNASDLPLLGSPIWLLYRASEIASERNKSVDPPSFGKCAEDILGRLDCDNLSAVNLPYSSSGSQSTSRSPKPAFFSFGTYILSAINHDYRIVELAAQDRNGLVLPQITELTEQQIILQGQAIQFELRTPPTNGQQTDLRFFIRFEGGSGQPCEDCTFSLERAVTSN